MMQPTTEPVFSKFFPPHIVACTSDGRVDFTLDPKRPALSESQKNYLQQLTGLDIPEPSAVIQEHGDHICLIEECATVLPGDGLITSRRRCPISVRSADCLPIFLWDEKSDCIGLVHAGWKGSRSNIAGKAVEQMSAHFGSDPQDIKAAFGPAICPDCYRVGGEFAGYFPEDVHERGGHYYLDLAGANQRRLIAAGVERRNIYNSHICTHCRTEYYSYRRDGDEAGRMISMMMINSPNGG